MANGYLFIESTEFTAMVKPYFRDDESYAELQVFLIAQPDAGPVIAGAGPLRKLRWKDARRGKSKRGGLRIVYIHIPDARVLFMLDVYDKDEADDLTVGEKRELKTLADELVRELRGRVGR